MIPDTITATRTDDVRRYIEFDALSNLVCLLAENFSNDWSGAEVLREIGWDTLVVVTKLFTHCWTVGLQ